MLLPYNVDVPMYRLPFVNWVLIALTVVVSVICLPIKPPPPDINADTDTPPEIVVLRHLVREPPPPPLSVQPKQFAWWQLGTYVLVHRDLAHLIGNMLFLFCFGNAINAKVGHLPFLGLYFGLGAIVGLAWVVLGQEKALNGASGAIMGILGIFLVLYPRNDVRVAYLGLGGVGTRERSALLFVLLGMASDFLGVMTSPTGFVLYLCHLGIELFGAALAIALLLLGAVQSTLGEQNLLQLVGFQEENAREKTELGKRRIEVGRPSLSKPRHRDRS